MMPESERQNVLDGGQSNAEQVVKAIDFALTNVSVCEDPVGSNRGPEIDAWAREFGSPLGSYWCALAVGKARKVGGLWIPPRDVGSCDEWYLAAETYGKIIGEPCHGAAVLYTNGAVIESGRYAGRKDAIHIGLVVRVKPRLFSVEGNTTLGKFDRNGYAQTLKEVDQKRVLCYIAP